MADITVTPTRIRPLVPSVIIRKTASEAMALGDLVQVIVDDEIALADASAAGTTSGLLGIVVSGNLKDEDGDIVIGERCDVLLFGRIAMFSGLTGGGSLYVSDTAGAIGDAAGTTSRIVGYAENAEVIFFNPA